SPAITEDTLPETNTPEKFVKLSSFILAALVFAGVNASLKWLPATHQALSLSARDFTVDGDVDERGRPPSWWLSRRYMQESAAPDIVIFGSSQIGGIHAAEAKFANRTIDWALDHHSSDLETKLNRQLNGKTSVFVCGIPGAMISDFYLISRTLFTPEKKP